MEELHVKNYGEYLNRLKESFGGAKQMPSDYEVQFFISRYNLDSDWKIIIADVRKDIRWQILNSKTIVDKQKRILSYKEYLIKLKDVFGIPKVMPEDSEIEAFILKFGLEKDWEITVKDVSKDLEKIISRKYDKVYIDAIHEPKPSVHKPVQQSYNYVPIVRKPVSVSRSTGSSILTYILPSDGCTLTDAQPALTKSTNLLKKSSASNPVEEECGQKKEEPELEKTILIDGDNHFDEGKKGIEHTSNDTEVIVFFSQSGAKEKFDRKYRGRPNVSSKLVPPAPQAVDNRIKSKAGQLLKKRNQDVIIVSQDSDFKKYVDRKKNNELGNKISTAKSVEERLKKDRKKK